MASQTVGQITMTLVVSWITSECSHASTAVRHPHHMGFIIPTVHCANTAYEGKCNTYTLLEEARVLVLSFHTHFNNTCVIQYTQIHSVILGYARPAEVTYNAAFHHMTEA